MTPTDLPPSGCNVLSHPLFEREPVHNERRPGRKKGVFPLATAVRKRREREEADRARAPAFVPGVAFARGDRGANDLLAAPPPGPTMLRTAQTPVAQMEDHERAVVGAALAVLSAHLRKPGAALDAPDKVKAFLTLHLAERRREAFCVLFLDQRHSLIAFEVMSEGTVTQTYVYPRELVRRALELNAVAVILAHNHPSSDAQPSRADVVLTAALKDALKVIEVRVLDHVIVAGLDAFSFAEHGVI